MIEDNKCCTKVYIEISEGNIQNIYTNADDKIEIVVCDYDNALAEKDGDGFDFEATKACAELENCRCKLKHIY